MRPSRTARNLLVLLRLAPAAVLTLGAAEPSPMDSKVFDAMRAELERTTADLRLPNAPAPYYAGYWVVDASERSVEASLGAVVSDETTKDRFVRVELRVGSHDSDNSNYAGKATDGDFMREAELLSPRPAPIDDSPQTLQHVLWLATDAAYKGAVETLERKRATKQSEIAMRGDVPSFSIEPATFLVVPEPASVGGDVDPRALGRQVSAIFRAIPEVQKSEVHVLQTSTRRRFLSSEGSLAVEPARFSGIEITCEGQAEDGMPLERTAFLAAPVGGALSPRAGEEEARRIGRELSALGHAAVVEDYAGPVLFEGRAAAQLVYELLGESLSGTPSPEGNEEMEGHLSRKLGRRILPRGVNVVDDPTLGSEGGSPLLGHYALDDEGVPGERVSLVEDGRLTHFLMSRTPREGVLRSNGHGRSGLVGWARGHVSNLMMSATGKSALAKPALRARFLGAVRDEGGKFGIIVTELEPRTSATNGEVMPTVQVAYRVALDGKETLVRGATLAPMNVRDLRDILAVGQGGTVYSFLSESDG
ncbi:MAG TPA: metallopeptidase TldD-related protein, partial [Polyangiaceae bacterium]